MKRSIPTPSHFARSLGFMMALACATCGLPQAFANVTTIVNNGSPNNRVDMVFIGDGYTANQQDTVYLDHVNNYLDHMFGTSQDGYFFDRYRNFFNVHVVESISPQAGADIPLDGIAVNTLLNAEYELTSQGSSDDRLLTIDRFAANRHADTALQGTGITPDMRLATVNSTKYGGSGGFWSVWAGGNGFATEVALHEVGHSFADLADEYAGNPTPYTGPEPIEPNATADPVLGKWDRWLGYDDPDTSAGPIGYYEGSRYFDEGIWRPTENGKMRSLDRPFSAVSREAFIESIYESVNPLDNWLDTGQPITDPAEDLWVQSVDPDVFAIDWYIDGLHMQSNAGEVFDLDALGPGDFQVEARVYDRILDFTNTGQSLDWFRLEDTTALQQAITWSVQLAAVDSLFGDYNASGSVEQGDLDLVLANWGNPVANVPAAWVSQRPTTSVAQAELDAVLSNWGSTMPPDLRGVRVPEPGLSAIWAMLATATFFRHRPGLRRRKYCDKNV